MHLIDDDDGMLSCEAGETLTVTVEPNDKTSESIVYSLDGRKHDGSPFPASNASHPPKGRNTPTRIFSVGVIYVDKTNGGGSARITITGSEGGDTSRITVRQSRPAEAGDITNYLIFV
jgi:hypothetical protein